MFVKMALAAGRGLQTEAGVGPVQHQLIVHALEIETDRWRYAGRVFDRHKVEICPVIRTSCHEHVAAAVQSHFAEGAGEPIRPERYPCIRISDRRAAVS